jgi:hypothetical protein
LINSKKIKEDLRSSNGKMIIIQDKENNNMSLTFAGEEEKVVKWLKIFEFVLNKK